MVLASVKLSAGKLDRRITFQDPTEWQDEGEYKQDWTNSNYATVWAQVLPVRGRETFLAKQVYAETITRFIIRYRTDITKKMRVFYNTNTGVKYHNIISISEIGRKEGLEIIASAFDERE